MRRSWMNSKSAFKQVREEVMFVNTGKKYDDLALRSADGLSKVVYSLDIFKNNIRLSSSVIC